MFYTPCYVALIIMGELDIKFTYGNSFVGTSYSMEVNGKDYNFGFDTENDVKEQIVEILKNEYEYKIDKDDIEFKWDGTM